MTASNDSEAPEPRGPLGPGEFYPVVGVGPHPKPWPSGNQYDQELLEFGDQRNVVDKYRYWTVPAIVADLDLTRSPLHIAIENWQHDLNIGSIVRTANAFNVAGVHIVGKKGWNRRGAMVTDRYLHLFHHPTVADFRQWSTESGVPIIGIDNVPGCGNLESATLPKSCVLYFGQEGPGMSEEGLAACTEILGITQHGSTRSMNASAAGAIAIYAWAMQHLNS
ncbi:MAG: RNA methyltransferase [Actinomycetales bacterium]|nr:RNA methyltransferase [Actinomycetales bacterium]